ncbi:hypothetical protein D7I44_07560 [Gryllotalpicola protaetiae]|uniref:Uncharacterized protein n=2 Tax=Gryllotalpicola protaetiae TaxID=2419771 RepID=A0A387BHV3_9MICO|nr:hypothetical protein D7I44_07560 [Gryllotalpicola protaetiae]
MRAEPQYDASGRLFRWELRDLAAERVFYGTSATYLLATQIAGYTATDYPTVPDLAAQLAARHDYAVDLATVMQSARNSRFEEEHGSGAINRLPRFVAATLRVDKRRWSGIRSWRRDLPALVVPESTILFSQRAASIPRGNVELVHDLDELSLLANIASVHGLQLVDRATDEDKLW